MSDKEYKRIEAVIKASINVCTSRVEQADKCYMLVPNREMNNLLDAVSELHKSDNIQQIQKSNTWQPEEGD